MIAAQHQLVALLDQIQEDHTNGFKNKPIEIVQDMEILKAQIPTQNDAIL